MVLLGFSVGNGYFSSKRVEIAVAAFSQLSNDVTLIVPDAISIHTYRALGYTEAQCRVRVRRKGLHMTNRVRRAMILAEAKEERASLSLIGWATHVAHLPEMEFAIAKVERLMESSGRFRADVMDTAESVLQGRRDGEFSDRAVREAANYLIAELAFVSISARHFGAHVIVPYYRPFQLGADLCAGHYGEPIENVSWPVYDIELAGASAGEEADFEG